MKNKKIIALGSLFFTILIVVIGTSYALVSKTVTGTKTYTISVGQLDFSINSEDGIITFNDAYPISDSSGMMMEPYTFTLTNNSSVDLSYDISLIQDTSDTTVTHLSPDYVKYYLVQGNNEAGPAIVSSSEYLYSGTIKSNSSLNFALRIWLDLNATISEEGKVFKAKLQINATQIISDTIIGKTEPIIDSVEKWLETTMTTKGLYTTMSDVLNDTTTLHTLMTNNNSIDYLVRSTSFVDAIISNEDAMSYIGENDYSADTLLSDATWKSSILSSNYFEKVLNVSIPIMTSATEPSGVVITSGSNVNYPALNAFNNTGTSSYWLSSSTTSGWIGYEFDERMKLYKLDVIGREYGTVLRTQIFDLEASNDGVDWVKIEENVSVPVITPNSLTTFSINCDDYYKMYRLNYVGYTHSEITPSISSIQFYGRGENNL